VPVAVQLDPKLEWHSGPGWRGRYLEVGMWEFTGMGYWEFTTHGWRRIPGTRYYNGNQWVMA